MKVRAKFENRPVSSVHEFLQILRERSFETAEDGRRSDVDSEFLGGTYIRGQARDDWDLIPTIGRQHSYAGKNIQHFDKKQEFLLLNRFRRQSFFHFRRVMSEWEAMFVARHFGLPVRLLDWSSNPLVALYWACQSERKRDGAEFDGCLWLIERGPPPERFLDIFREASKNPLRIKGIRTVPPLFVDPRFSAQASVFTIHEEPWRPMDEVLAEGIEKRHCDVEELIWWRVPAGSKPGILVDLEKMGVNARTLFPDLSGLSLGLWRTELVRSGTPGRSNGHPNGKAGSPGKPRFSRRRRAQLKLQGQYIGYLRNLKPKQKAEVRKVRDARGVMVAIRKAKELAS
jgi:FRG domain-containing protein